MPTPRQRLCHQHQAVHYLMIQSEPSSFVHAASRRIAPATYCNCGASHTDRGIHIPGFASCTALAGNGAPLGIVRVLSADCGRRTGTASPRPASVSRIHRKRDRTARRCWPGAESPLSQLFSGCIAEPSGLGTLNALHSGDPPGRVVADLVIGRNAGSGRNTHDPDRTQACWAPFADNTSALPTPAAGSADRTTGVGPPLFPFPGQRRIMPTTLTRR
jgi:hypothetical protein